MAFVLFFLVALLAFATTAMGCLPDEVEDPESKICSKSAATTAPIMVEATSKQNELGLCNLEQAGVNRTSCELMCQAKFDSAPPESMVTDCVFYPDGNIRTWEVMVKGRMPIAIPPPVVVAPLPSSSPTPVCGNCGLGPIAPPEPPPLPPSSILCPATYGYDSKARTCLNANGESITPDCGTGSDFDGKSGLCVAHFGPTSKVSALDPKAPANVADLWRAEKQNKAMLDAPVESAVQTDTEIDPQTGRPLRRRAFISQADGYKSLAGVLEDCVQTQVSGRTDAACANAPDNPECVGLKLSIANATVCNAPVNPANPAQACASYGANGYTMEEWLTFGLQYYNGMTACYDIKGTDRVDAQGQVTAASVDTLRGNIQSLTDMVEVPLLDAIGKSVSSSAKSSITGSSSSVPVVASAAGYKPFTSQLDDGAVFLGYEKGAILQKSLQHESFVAVVTESPFLEKLTASTREKVESALANSDETLSKARERKLAQSEPTAVESLEAKASAGSGAASSAAFNSPVSVVASTANTAATISAQAAQPAASSSGVTKAGDKSATSISSTQQNAAALESSALFASHSVARDSSTGRGLASVGTENSLEKNSAAQAQAQAQGAVDTSLFERVKATYHRRSNGLKALEDSATAKDLRRMEEPAFFRGL